MRPIIQATLIAGTLDILAAMGLTVWHGRSVGDMLRFVASGPFSGASQWGVAGAVLGLAVHFALMAVMVWAFFLAARRWPVLLARPVLSGAAYGALTFVIMNLIVVPARFGTSPSVQGIVTQLFCHIVLVGIPIALIAAGARRRA